MLRLVVCALVLIMSATAAQAACGPFPRSNFIGDFSHDQVRDYVAQYHAGDWQPYIDLLDANYTRLEAIANQGASTTLRVRGEPVEMSSSELARFAFVSGQFKDVVKCLASLPDADLIDLNEFATAAGGDETQSTAPEVAAAETSPQRVSLIGTGTGRNAVMSLSITHECRNGDTVFIVQNLGGAWPDTGMFSMFRLDGDNRQMIGARRLTLGTGDEREITVSSSQNRTGHVGIAIDPSWYDRGFVLDADARCN